MEYEVTITETLKKNVYVEANSLEEAMEKVSEKWNNGNIILDAEAFCGVDFEGNVCQRGKMKVIILEPGKLARVDFIGTELEDLQKVVGGRIEPAYYFEEPVCMVVNEEGKILELPLNRTVYNDKHEMIDIVAGTAFICDCSTSKFKGLTQKQIDKYMDEFKYPEQFFKINNKIKALKFYPEKEKEPER